MRDINTKDNKQLIEIIIQEFNKLADCLSNCKVFVNTLREEQKIRFYHDIEYRAEWHKGSTILFDLSYLDDALMKVDNYYEQAHDNFFIALNKYKADQESREKIEILESEGYESQEFIKQLYIRKKFEELQKEKKNGKYNCKI